MATQQEPANGRGSINKLDKINTGLGVGFVGLDSYMRMKEGESAPVAVGKALLTNAVWSMAPGGLLGGLAISAGAAAVQVAPDLINAAEQKKAKFHANRNRFGSNYQSSQAQQSMQYQGLNQIQQARQHVTANMANHARGAQRVY
ncbi:hypothetical protein [Virgibacillus salexigens]|uniref:Uncharacterized protein n=1 Tax=Virgibacillus massiliensis TaxID=1462526 RepID=A0A024QGZ1_9BACI|nr:hypothetical protein [Virgibacillus massiliensis]CDQ41833.1 hypothetical protein BN990_04210 [Virgibacillus massiliensis]